MFLFSSPESVKMWPYWKKGLCRCNHMKDLEMRSSRIRHRALNPMPRVLMKERQRVIWDREEKAVWRQKQRLDDAAASRGWPGAARAGRGEGAFSLRTFGGNMALLTLWFQTSGLYYCREINSCCFKPWVCGNLLWPKENNTIYIYYIFYTHIYDSM